MWTQDSFGRIMVVTFQFPKLWETIVPAKQFLLKFVLKTYEFPGLRKLWLDCIFLFTYNIYFGMQKKRQQICIDFFVCSIVAVLKHLCRVEALFWLITFEGNLALPFEGQTEFFKRDYFGEEKSTLSSATRDTGTILYLSEGQKPLAKPSVLYTAICCALLNHQPAPTVGIS